MLRCNRRTFVTGTLAGSCAAFIPSFSRAAAPPAKILERKVIRWQPQLYKGWPTVARLSNGDLMLVYSGGRESHVCPFGQVKMMRSRDEGKSWTWPRVLLDGPIDDRDSGVLETSNKTLLVTSFSSLAYESILERARKKVGESGAWAEERLERWLAAHHRETEQGRRKSLGVWMTRSTDGGRTWSGRYDCKVNSPHGPIQLSDGRLLYAGKELWGGEKRVGLCQSLDDGKSWQWLATIEPREGDTRANYHELHAVEAPSGRLVVQIRNHNSRNSRETLQCESEDGGETWTKPHAIGVWGLPSHLLRLRDGRLLMTYGHRREPLGNQARVSEDEGKSWSDPIFVSDDGTSGDLGYPSTVQLSDSSLLTVWYERQQGASAAALRQAHWKLGQAGNR